MDRHRYSGPGIGTRTAITVPFSSTPTMRIVPPIRSTPFSHTQKPQRPAIQLLVSRSASPVVRDRQQQLVVLFLLREIHPGCLSVTQDVCQRFLKHTEHSGRLLPFEMHVFHAEITAADDSSLGLTLVSLPSNRGYQPDVIEDGRPQLR